MVKLMQTNIKYEELCSIVKFLYHKHRVGGGLFN